MAEKINTNLMIISLGGSPEPLIKSISYHKPEKIIFLASQDSILLAGDILKSIDYKPDTEFEITENPNMMFECYGAARRCIDRVKRKNIKPDHVIVDYTGGTKVMTASLILATIGEPYHFNYVGGEKRNKEGVGIVIDGFETMYPEMSPWSIFAEEERRQIVTLFNSRRFSSVIKIIEFYDRTPPRRIRDYFSFVSLLAEGFLCWEQFDHKAAYRKLTSAYEALTGYIELYIESSLETFSKQVEIHLEYLERLVSQTDSLKNKHNILVHDLVNNARRRISDKRYDDAAARLYRALELYGQIIFEENAGCDNDRVAPELVPDAIKDEFVRKYYDPAHKKLKLPLTATFQYLEVIGHEAGKRFFKNISNIKKIQSNRNYSILAHGIKPISEKAVNSILNTVSDFVNVKDFFDFPMLP
ncbi:MAG: TIGR02710 family CRISPR-associated CARF protein [Desulfobacteraceae bacterium]